LSGPFAAVLTVMSLMVVTADRASAHCDGLDGPVVAAAKKALETGNVNLVLIWAPPASEPEIRTAFAQTMVVRKHSSEARSLADRAFFETLVRIHRMAEGAAYTGLKPAGRDLGPAIPAADDALRTARMDRLRSLLTDAVGAGLERHFKMVSDLAHYDADDVPAGRRYVAAYVAYMHYVEQLYDVALTNAEGHYQERQ
jgi:hypothetical protein